MFPYLLSGAFGAALALGYPTKDSQFNKITNEVLTILKKTQRPLFQNLAEEASRNTDYLINAKPFGIENGVPKAFVAATAIYLAYYGYKKYQKYIEEQEKYDSNKQENTINY